MGESPKYRRREEIRNAFRERDRRISEIDKEIADKEYEWSSAEVELDEHPGYYQYEQMNRVDRELSDLYDEKRDLENNITGFKNGRQKADYRRKEYEESLRRYRERRVNRNNI